MCFTYISAIEIYIILVHLCMYQGLVWQVFRPEISIKSSKFTALGKNIKNKEFHSNGVLCVIIGREFYWQQIQPYKITSATSLFKAKIRDGLIEWFRKKYGLCFSFLLIAVCLTNKGPKVMLLFVTKRWNILHYEETALCQTFLQFVKAILCGHRVFPELCMYLCKQCHFTPLMDIGSLRSGINQTGSSSTEMINLLV